MRKLAHSDAVALSQVGVAQQLKGLSDAASRAVREILEAATALNTRRSYTSAMAYWVAWHEARFGECLALPVAEAVVVQFLVDHFGRPTIDEGGSAASFTWELPGDVDAALVAQGVKQRRGPLRISTVMHRVSVLSAAHAAAGVPNPVDNGAIRMLLRRCRRAAHAGGERPRKKAALTAQDIRDMMEACGDDLIGIRDRALLAFGFGSGGRRRSEIAEADFANLRRTGPASYVYVLARSKTRRVAGGAPSEKPVVGDSAVALSAWIDASGLSEGPVFRRVRGARIGEGLSAHAVAEIIRRRALAAGIVGDIAGHSVRSGFATEAGRRGTPLAEAMALTDHRSAQTFLGYYQAGAVELNRASRMLDLDSIEPPDDEKARG